MTRCSSNSITLSGWRQVRSWPWTRFEPVCDQFRTGFEAVTDWFKAGHRPASYLSVTSFEPHSVMEFGFNVILPLAKFTSHSSLALSYIGSITAQHSSSVREPNYGAGHRALAIFMRLAMTLCDKSADYFNSVAG